MGMLCSEKELGLAEESEGILILPPGLPLGAPGLRGSRPQGCLRLELVLTPNRADCLSVLGVAREVAAMVGQPLRLPVPRVEEAGEAIDLQTSVMVEEPELCPRYAARLIRGVNDRTFPGLAGPATGIRRDALHQQCGRCHQSMY